MQKNLAPIWAAIAEIIGANVTKDTFRRWFEAIELIEADEEALVLGVPNNIYQFWIESNYMSLVNSAIADVLGAPRTVRFSVISREARALTPAPADGDDPASGQRVPAPAPDLPGEAPANRFAGNGNGTGNGFMHANGHDNGSGSAERSENSAAASAPAPAAATPVSNGMNPRNTFDSFVVGLNNQFAHAAALAVAQNPARKYNPFFIHGRSGLGKTHLMHAVGQSIAARGGKGGRVLYVTSESFTNDFIDAIQNGTLVKFRKRYRQADVLLIDDIQFLAGKERSQEEFFHTFNALFDGYKQIVLSSDRPPSEIANLEQRLVSRFECGLTAELQPPDVETRMAILRKKAEALAIKLDNAVFEYIANCIRNNVRRLEGALMRVASYASLNEAHPTAELVEFLLKDFLQEEGRRTVTIDQIKEAVADHFDLRIADMTSKRRPANIAFPRQIAMFLARELTRASLNEIGDAFGGRDHGTVIHAHKLVKHRMQKEDKVRQMVTYLDARLHA